MNDIHPVLAEVTDRITARSKDSRTAYLTQVRAAGDRGPPPPLPAPPLPEPLWTT